MSGSRSVRAFVLILTGYAVVRTTVVFAPDLWASERTPLAAEPAAKQRGLVGPPVDMAAETGGAQQLLHPAPAPSVFVSAQPIQTLLERRDDQRPARGDDRATTPRGNIASPIQTVLTDIVPAGERDRTDGRPSPPRRPDAAPAQIALAAQAPASAVTGSRWSGFAYLFHRGDRGSTGGLAPAGQIGGSQAAARIAWRLDDTGHLALAARAAAALRSPSQAELAAGIDIRPVSGLRLSLERRIAIRSGGRDAWSAYAAAGAYRAIGAQLELDGYAQAGLVGARARDPFADGALRIGRRTALAPVLDLRLGAGAWGAAQPGAARLDIGPRAALSLRTARLPVTIALEGRLRIAGHARPGNGAALTLATDF